MDANTIKRHFNESIITPAPSPKPKSLENNGSALETRPNNSQDSGSKISSGATVKLSDTSIKLSTSSPVKSSDKAAPIEDKDQAQQAVRQLVADFQSNPSQAHQAHSNVFAGAVKSLLGPAL